MKKIIFILVGFIFSYNLMLSAEPKLLWSNLDNSMGEILYSGLSETSDTLVIIERNYINLYDNKTKNLIHKYHLNEFAGGLNFDYLVDGISLPNPNKFNFVFLPLIFFNSYIIDLDKKIITPITTNSINFGIDGKSPLVTSTYVDYNGKDGATIYCMVFELDLNQKSLNKIFSRNSKQHGINSIHFAVRLNDSSILYTSNYGAYIYNILDSNSKKIEDPKIISFLPYQSITTKDNKLYLFKSDNFGILSFDLQTYKFEEYNKQPTAQNSNNITVISSPINPGILFYNYKETYQDGTFKFVELIYDLQSSTILFERKSDYPIIALGLQNNQFEYIKLNRKDSSNNESYYDISTTNIQTNEEIIDRTFISSKPKIMNNSNNQLLVGHDKYLEQWNKDKGELISKVEYPKKITKIHNIDGTDENFILLENKEMYNTKHPDYRDFPFFVNFPMIGFKHSPNYSVVVLYSNNSLLIMDSQTLSVKDVLYDYGGAFDFINDSLLIFKLQNYYEVKPALYNVNSKQIKYFNKDTISKVKSYFYEKSNKKIYAISSDSTISEIRVDSLYSSKVIYKNNADIIKASISYKDEYLALIEYNSEPKIPKFNNLKIVNLETKQETYKSGGNNFADLLFSNVNNNFYYVRTAGTSINLSRFNIYTNKEDSLFFAKVSTTDYMLNNNYFWLHIKFLDMTDDYRLILHDASNVFWSINPDNLKDSKYIGFNPFYNDAQSEFHQSDKLIYNVFYNWKYNRAFSFYQANNKAYNKNHQNISILNSEDLSTKKISKRILTDNPFTTFYFNNEASTGLLFNHYISKINPVESSYIKILEIPSDINFSTTALLSPNDRMFFGKNDNNQFIILDLNNKNFKESGTLNSTFNDFFNNDLLIYSDYKFIIIYDFIGKKEYYKMEYQKLYTNSNYISAFKKTTIKDNFFTGHVNGLVHFWLFGEKSPTFSINTGAGITSIDLFDNDKKLIITNKAGYIYCYDVEDIIISGINESKEDKEQQIIISPNPAREYITINLDRCATLQKCGTSAVEIYDMMGIQIQTTPSASQPPLHVGNLRIDVSHLPTGVYFVKFGGRVQKFVKM